MQPVAREVGVHRTSIYIWKETKALLHQETKGMGISLFKLHREEFKDSFLYKRLPKKKIEHAKGAAESIFSLKKPLV